MRTRPLDIITAEGEAIQLGISVSEALVETCLTQRLRLLDAGWPVEHTMCRALDQLAQNWAAQATHGRTELATLARELMGVKAKTGG